MIKPLAHLDSAFWLTPDRGFLHVSGWVFRPSGPRIIAVRFRSGGQTSPGYYGIHRLDVSRAHAEKAGSGNPPGLHSGFSILVRGSIESLPGWIEAEDEGGEWIAILEVPAGRIVAAPPARIDETAVAFPHAIAGGKSFPEKPVLFISHDFVSAGAQLLLERLLSWLKRKTSLTFEILLAVPPSLIPRASEEDRALLGAFLQAGPVHFVSEATGLPENLPAIRAGNYSLLYANTSGLGPLLGAIQPVTTPIVSHVHELDFWIEKRIGREAFQIQADHTDRFIACSTPVRKTLVGRLGVSPEEVEVIHDSASTERAMKAIASHTRESVRLELGLPADAFVVVACGTCDWRKGADLFIPICADLRNRMGKRALRAIWIGLCGDTLVKDQFDYDAAMAGLTEVEFVGPQPDPHRWMLAADCFALPSREDPFPIVMLEAATMGLPIVGFAGSGGVSEFAEQGAGIIVPYLDLGAFAGALARLAADPELAARLGAKAASRVASHYDQETGFGKILELILTLARPGEAIE